MFKLSEITKTALRAATAVAALLLAGGVQAQGGRTLQSIDFTSQDDDRVLLTLTLSEAAPEPVVFTIDKPARLSLDLPETSVALPERYKKVNSGNVRSVASAEAKGRTRVVVELNQLAPYSLKVEGNKILVQLDDPSTAATSTAPAQVTGARLNPAPALSPESASSLRNIDFRRGERGEGRIIVQLANARTPVDVREEGGKIIAAFRGATAVERLLKRLDVLDFATPVKYVDTRRDGNDIILSVTPAAGVDYEQAAYQTGDQFTLEIQPLTPERVEEKRKAQPQFVGERISLSFQNIETRSLLQIIADVAGTNMVVSDQVDGEIAMRLQNVPWDQALDIVLRTKGLGMRQQGNVMQVAPLKELAEREKVELETVKQRTDLSPLRSEIIQVNYAKATDLAPLIKSGSSNNLLSDRGRLSVDERTNTLIVLETREKIDEMRLLVARLDIPVRQVLIESRIVIANDDFAKDLGVRFGVTTVARNGGSGLVTTSGSNNATDTTVDSFLNGGGFPVTLGSQANRYNVNLPVTDPAGQIALAILGRDYLVDLELSALQSEGRGEVVSTPRVVTANGKQAYVEQGRELPYLESASSGAGTIAFKKAVLSLLVTPQITPDDRVVMDLAVTNDSQGQNVSTGFGGTAPAIDTRRLNTQVLVRSGETVVLGGVYNQENRADQAKVPLLGDVPMLGRLFRNDSKSSSKRELLIFVTPKVLQEGLRIN